jgi:hypothetical protein
MEAFKRRGMLHRAIFISLWAKVAAPKTRNQADLIRALDRLKDLSSTKFEFADHCKSSNGGIELEQQNEEEVALQYEKVVALVREVLNDIARKEGKGPVLPSQMSELMFGKEGVLSSALIYGEIHAGD